MGGQHAPVSEVQREDFRFWTEEKLRNMDTDQFRHVNHSAMITFFEAGRMEIFRSSAIGAFMDGVSIAVVRLLMSFHRELFYPGSVRIGSSVTNVGRTSFEVRQGLFGADGLVASAEATCVLIDDRTRRPHPVAEELRAYLLAPTSSAGP